MENKLEADKRQPEETWAHYIKRNIGRENFDEYNKWNFDDEVKLEGLQSLSNSLHLDSCCFSRGYIIEVNEVCPTGKTESIKYLEPWSEVLISKDDDDPFLSIFMYEDRAEVGDHDPKVIPPEIVTSINAYRTHEEIQAFVDDLVAGIKKMLEGGDENLRR